MTSPIEQNQQNQQNQSLEHQEQPKEQETDFIETSIIGDIYKNIENLENQITENQTEDFVIESRVKQLTYSKLLVNIYQKDVFFLIKSHTNLGISYLNFKYFEQAQEHLLNAFKLNDQYEGNEEKSVKDMQILILTHLSKSYLELKKLSPALNISEKCLKMNISINGEDHVSNTDIYYILARCNAELENFKAAEGYFSKIFDIYEKTYGFDSEKCAQTCIELGKIYELNRNIVEAAEYFKFAYEIYDKVVRKSPSVEVYDKIYESAEKHSSLLSLNNENQEAFSFLKKTFESRFEEEEFKCSSKELKRINLSRLVLKYADLMKNYNSQYIELKRYSELVIDYYGDVYKELIRIYKDLGVVSYKIDIKKESNEYFEKAIKLCGFYSESKMIEEIRKLKEKLCV